MNDREMLLICYGAMKGNPENDGDAVLALLEEHVNRPSAVERFEPSSVTCTSCGYAGMKVNGGWKCSNSECKPGP